MGLKSLYQDFDSKVHVLSRKMGAKQSARHYFNLRSSQGLPIVRLTAEQKALVQKTWNGHVKNGAGFATHELVLSATGEFDPYICPELLFRTNIELGLNNFQLKYGFSEKNYFDKLFPDIPMPKAVVRNINGVFLDEQYHPLTEAEAFKLMGSYDRLIAKPSMENGCGKAVKLFQNEEIAGIDKAMGSDYIVQEVLGQYPGVAALNPSSVNVVRVVSLSLNGKVSPVNCALRCGAAGAVTDNHITKEGRGMFVVGVNPDGTLKENAYYSCGDKLEGVAPNGATFAGLQLPNFDQALVMTTKIHEALPHFGFVAFDVCFDEDGSPRIMEFNIRGPGVLYYQYANGPLFGERTQEIIETFCK